MKRIMILLLVIIVLAGAWYGYKLYTGEVPSLTEVKADASITATDLIAAFEKDSASANKQYLGKILEVSGNVKSVEKESATLSLGTAEGNSSVRCSVDSAFVKDIEALNPGTAITIKGNCTGFMPDETGLGLGSDVVLNRCVFERKNDILSMKNIIFVTLSFFLFSSVTLAQDKFYTKNANISFFSETRLEDIEAKNYSAVSVLDSKSGSLQFSLLTKGFEFKNEEMQEHFNDDYMESDKFPKAEFKGQVLNNAAVNYKKSGTYNVQVKGLLTIHGVTKEVQTTGTLKVDNDNIKANSVFNIALADYGIKIPKLVSDKIAKNIKITVDAKLDPLK